MLWEGSSVFFKVWPLVDWLWSSQKPHIQKYGIDSLNKNNLPQTGHKVGWYGRRADLGEIRDRRVNMIKIHSTNSQELYKREKNNLTFWDIPVVLMYLTMQIYQKIVFVWIYVLIWNIKEIFMPKGNQYYIVHIFKNQNVITFIKWVKN